MRIRDKFLTHPLISIHSLRVEGDNDQSAGANRHRHFNPLPPCGGRLAGHGRQDVGRVISIHSLRVEGDRPQRRP